MRKRERNVYIQLGLLFSQPHLPTLASSAADSQKIGHALSVARCLLTVVVRWPLTIFDPRPSSDREAVRDSRFKPQRIVAHRGYSSICREKPTESNADGSWANGFTKRLNVHPL